MAIQPRRFLFLLSHMRSYSSLLSHVLGSSPEIDGYCETHIRYRHRTDYYRLRFAIRRHTGEPLRGHWLLDKILHNRIRSPYLRLRPEQYKVLMFVRAPADTLRSMLTMPRQPGDAPVCEQRACDYYVSRLQRLRIEGEQLGRQALYFDAEAITTATGTLLGALAGWLELPSAPGERYRLFPRSGKAPYGDPSAMILRGHVTRDRHEQRLVPAISPAVLREADAAYQRCRESLQRLCLPLAEVVRDHALQVEPFAREYEAGALAPPPIWSAAVR
jgi:hypothetical protein